MNIIWCTIILALIIMAGVFYMEYIQKFFKKMKKSYAKLFKWGLTPDKPEPPKKRGRPRKKK
jgi:hypothetical protein